MVYSLVQAHFRSRRQDGPEEEAQQDLIRGKGTGFYVPLPIATPVLILPALHREGSNNPPSRCAGCRENLYGG